MIVTAHALIRRCERGARGVRLLHVRLRGPVTALASDTYELRRRRARFEPAGQAKAGRVALHAVGIDLHFSLLEHFPRVGVLRVRPALVIVLMTVKARLA